MNGGTDLGMKRVADRGRRDAAKYLIAYSAPGEVQ